VAAYASCKRMPEEKTWLAFDAAVARVARSLTPQGVANTLRAYAVLGKEPGDEAWAALDAAAARSVRGGIDVSTTVWAYAMLHTSRGVALPACYPALWDAIRGMESRDFGETGLLQLFHAHLMHQYFPPPGAVKLAYPDWLLVESRDVWTRQLPDHDLTHMSKPHRKLARIIHGLGFRSEVERVTENGSFSMDIYLPDHDVAVEFDGPSHYYTNYLDDFRWHDHTPTTPPQKTARTDLRDMILGKQCAKVLTVPFYEFYRHNVGPKHVTAYVKDTLTVALAALKKEKANKAAPVDVITAPLDAAADAYVPAAAVAARGAHMGYTTATDNPSAAAAVAADAAGAGAAAAVAAVAEADRALDAESERWKATLPKRALQKLLSEVSAAGGGRIPPTPARDAERLAVFESALTDTTKVRASARRALLDAHERFTAAKNTTVGDV
jgi:hypothetical protein